MISIPDSSTLIPQTHGHYQIYRSTTTDLIRLDLLFEAGSAYQPQPLCASAANKLCTVATRDMDSAALSEFMDYRGVIVETNCEVLQNTITVYMLRRYADEVLPIVANMLSCPSFAENDFRPWQAKRRHEILANEQRSATQARRLFYEALFGVNHPLGRHAEASDVDRLSIDTVRSYFFEKSSSPTGIILAGNIDDELFKILNSCCFNIVSRSAALTSLSPSTKPNAEAILHHQLQNSVQTTLRVGRVIPMAWDSLDYARLMLAVTVLGGYFGSRLMSNLRENKGYTYGIYARTQIYRGTIVFYITADVAAGTAKKAIDEIMKELRRLCDEPIMDDELQLVKTVMTGDFLRSVDGIFERAARYADMVGCDINERFTDNLREILIKATPAEIQHVANLYLKPEDMVVCTAGA